MRKHFLVLLVSLLILTGNAIAAAGPATQPTTRPAGLTDAQMLERATAAVVKETPGASVVPAGSYSKEIGTWVMPNPLPEYRFFCAWLRETVKAPERQFIAVSRSGQILRPFDEKQFGELVSAADRSSWKDEDYLKAACLYVHLCTPLSQDGWKLLTRPEDFTAIDFQMAAIGGREAQKEAARQIQAPIIEHGRTTGTTVTFYEWHLIGGDLKRWTITFGKTAVKAEKQELGRFGGTNYE